jgi:hypothetical protein
MGVNVTQAQEEVVKAVASISPGDELVALAQRLQDASRDGKVEEAEAVLRSLSYP